MRNVLRRGLIMKGYSVPPLVLSPVDIGGHKVDVSSGHDRHQDRESTSHNQTADDPM